MFSPVSSVFSITDDQISHSHIVNWQQCPGLYEAVNVNWDSLFPDKSFLPSDIKFPRFALLESQKRKRQTIDDDGPIRPRQLAVPTSPPGGRPNVYRPSPRHPSHHTPFHVDSPWSLPQSAVPAVDQYSSRQSARQSASPQPCEFSCA